jgi:hypothetical protein
VFVNDGGSIYSIPAPAGSDAHVGSIELGGPHGDLLVYSVIGNRGRGFAKVMMFDLATQQSSLPPVGVNQAKRSSTNPSVSGDYMLYDEGSYAGEDSYYQQKVVLYRFSTDSFQTLATAGSRQWVNAGRVAGDFVVYDVCGRYACNVFRYQISTDTTVKVPLAADKSNYWPTVADDGTVYWVSGSHTKCGVGTSLMKRDPAGVTTSIDSLPAKVEAATLSAYDDGGSTTLYFTAIDCSDWSNDIYQLANV